MTRGEILEVVETETGVFVLFIEVDDDDGASAIGHVFRSTGVRNDGVPATQVLATGDTLRAMWASPSGALWVGSADGNVATTAKVSWPIAAAGAEYKTMGGSPDWTATALPALPNGLPPNVEVLWGTGDNDVYAGIYRGHIFHWNGTAWRLAVEGPTSGYGDIRAFGGSSPDDVYAVGVGGTILHFDGNRWQRLRPPGPVIDNEVFTGVQCRANGEVLISSSIDAEQGRLLHGNALALVEFSRHPLPLMDMDSIDGRVFFATGSAVVELAGQQAQVIKSFGNVSMSAGRGRLFVLQPAQDVPSYVEYKPGDADVPWWRFTF